MRWPDADTVRKALENWAGIIRKLHPGIVAIGYFGSYARGDWGVGSDLDIILVVDDSPLPADRRALSYDKESLPVPADLIVYTRLEFESLTAADSRFSRMIRRETTWLP